MTDSELTKVGLKRVDYSGFKVDFFSMDKTNPYEAVKALIENAVRARFMPTITRLPLWNV